jgi:hypothetical protein
MRACAREGLGGCAGLCRPRGWRSSIAHGAREAAKETRAAQRGAEGELCGSRAFPIALRLRRTTAGTVAGSLELRAEVKVP